MEFYRAGEFKEDVLEKNVEINPKEKAPRFVLNRLDYLIGFIREKSPKHVDTFTKNLEERYLEFVKKDYIAERGIDLGPLVSGLDNLEDYPSLVNSALNYYLQVLGDGEDRAWDKTVDVVNRGYHQAFLHPRYYNLLTMIEVMGRDEAIKLWKQFFTQYIIDNRTPRDSPFADLETHFEERRKTEEEPSDWVVVRGMIADGKYAYRNDNCLWVDALEDLPDSEIKYYVCCYGDYEGAKHLHESIVMTMEHTIAQGDPYCSRVLHDTRVDYDLRHPTKEFWDNMWPVKPADEDS